MNYTNQETTHALAAEYVMGTLRGGARRRFEQLMLENSGIRQATTQWESYFNDLALRLEPVVPDQSIWSKIQARIDSGTAITSGNNVSVLVPKRNRVWQGVSLLATAAAIVFAVLLFIPGQMQPEAVQQFTVVQNAESKALWLIEITQKTIDAQATDKVEQLANNDYELWMLPGNGSAPISLGLLPQSGSVSLAKNQLFDQLDISALAVSREPLGGSPSGAPTEVLYVSELALI